MTDHTAETVIHLKIVAGEDAGKTITVPPSGVLMGRSSKNDVMLKDPSLSRHHCRFFFKSGVLWVADLGSANQTLVNKVPIQEAELHARDSVVIGNTELQVCEARPAESAEGATKTSGPGGDFDLGLSPPAAEEVKRRPRFYLLLGLLGLTILVAGLSLHLANARRAGRRPGPAPVPAANAADTTLEIDYEKVQASTNNIFRYRLTLSK